MVTIDDVAKEAGVSRELFRMYLVKRDGISVKVTERVLNVAKELTTSLTMLLEA